jgi:hypothetical protein
VAGYKELVALSLVVVAVAGFNALVPPFLAAAGFSALVAAFLQVAAGMAAAGVGVQTVPGAVQQAVCGAGISGQH